MTTALVALLVAATPAAGRSYSVDPMKSVIRYHIVHKFHRVSGASSTIEGKGVLQADGTVLAMVRVPMATFDSGEWNRDVDMREAVEARQFPFVVFKGTTRLDGDVLAAAQPATVQARLEGEIELHGVKRSIVVPLTIELSPDGTARARGRFEVSLGAFAIERPSLLFVKIEDACKIDVDLTLHEEKR